MVRDQDPASKLSVALESDQKAESAQQRPEKIQTHFWHLHVHHVVDRATKLGLDRSG
jgi:hypothetical protein